MKLLILSANTGEGHNSAAKALEEYFTARGHLCRIQNGLHFMPRTKGELISRGHVFFYRKLPRVYGIGYRFEELQSQRQPYQKSLRHLRRKRHIPRKRPDLKAFLEAGGYDAVICCHVFVARLVSILRRQEEISIPCFFLATDYTCSPGVNQLDMDAWFIPHAGLVPEFAAHGIPADKLIPCGIPVRDEFCIRGDKADARQELGLPQDKKIAVLSCGSMGAGPMGRLALLLAATTPSDSLLIAICGNNRKLEKRLKKIYRGKKLVVKGFVERMSTYLDAADLFLTKPGGLSTTEAMHKGLPLMLINVAPGCETRNMEFLTKLGCAASANGMISLARLTADTLKSGGDLEALTRRCAEEFSRDSREIIYNTIEKSVRESSRGSAPAPRQGK